MIYQTLNFNFWEKCLKKEVRFIFFFIVCIFRCRMLLRNVLYEKGRFGRPECFAQRKNLQRGKLDNFFSCTNEFSILLINVPNIVYSRHRKYSLNKIFSKYSPNILQIFSYILANDRKGRIIRRFRNFW